MAHPAKSNKANAILIICCSDFRQRIFAFLLLLSSRILSGAASAFFDYVALRSREACAGCGVEGQQSGNLHSLSKHAMGHD
jgi:hypothetical protein